MFPIWEGTTNVLALDLLRALGANGMAVIGDAVATLLAEAGDDRHGIAEALAHVRDWHAARQADRDAREAGARGFAMTLARTFAAALLARHAAWARRERGDSRSDMALATFAGHGLSRLQ